MSANAFVIVSTTALLLGLAISVVIERFIAPIPPKTCRPLAVWSLHIGIFMMAFALVLVITQRPFFSTVLITVFLLLIVIISNAKFASLREPFTFQDFRYLSDAIRFPRLYLPFLGLTKAVLIAALILSAGLFGIWIESPIGSIEALLMIALGILIISSGFIWWGSQKDLQLSYLPEQDIGQFGLLTSLFLYWSELRYTPKVRSPFLDHKAQANGASSNKKPNLIAIQSESFFDPRPLSPTIRRDVLSEFDELRRSAIQYGDLQVPAWGANTVRTEFAFLSGIDGASLGAHRFNPYEAVKRGWEVGGIAKQLKNQGYKTICIHPYMASFYNRSTVFPLMGFDEFIDISQFQRADRVGPYISDQSVTEKILEIVEQTHGQPIFIFVITMENHGPLHLESITSGELKNYYLESPPTHWQDMSIYLRHLANADQMIGSLKKALEDSPEPTSLCWFGDHVPIMKDVYAQLDYLPRDTCYAIWSNYGESNQSPLVQNIVISQLGVAWLGINAFFDSR